jgi:hypothetical protein
MQLFSHFSRLTCIVKPLNTDDFTSSALAPSFLGLPNPLPGATFTRYSQLRYGCKNLQSLPRSRPASPKLHSVWHLRKSASGAAQNPVTVL